MFTGQGQGQGQGRLGVADLGHNGIELGHLRIMVYIYNTRCIITKTFKYPRINTHI